MTEDQAAPEAEPAAPEARQAPPAGRVTPAIDPDRPDYKGEPLDAERGPGLGCFWIQLVAFLVLFLLTPLGVINGWPAWLTTSMLILTLVLLLFVGQTVIFLLRLVAADRRSRRRPLREGARPTVGDLSTAESNGATGDSASGEGEAGKPTVRQ